MKIQYLRVTGAIALAVPFALANAAFAQTPSAGPPPPPAAAMPAAKPVAPAPPPAAKPAPAPAAKPVAAAAAAPAAAPQAPKPAAEIDQLKVLEATWRCEGKQPAGPFGPEHEYKSTMKGKKDVDAFWISFEYEQKKSKVHPMPVKAKGFIGYDPVIKKYVTTGVDNMGGWLSETSAGWEGDKLVFVGEGSMMGQKASFRETYAKKGDKELVWTGELKMGKDWIPVGTDTCKR